MQANISDHYASGSVRDAYVIHRIEEQITYYESKSSQNKKLYFRISIATIILNAMIPIISLFLPSADLVPKLSITIISSVTTILSSIMALTGTKELWTKYRSNASHLTAKLHQYYAKTGPFAGKNEEEAFHLLAAVCEAQMEDEYNQWAKNLTNDQSPQTN